MFGAHITVKALFLSICCWMASSSNAIPENALLSPKAKDRVFVTLSHVRVEKSRYADMYCIRGFREDKRRDPPKKRRSQQSLFMKLRPKPKRMRLFSSGFMAIMQQSSGSRFNTTISVTKSNK